MGFTFNQLMLIRVTVEWAICGMPPFNSSFSGELGTTDTQLLQFSI